MISSNDLKTVLYQEVKKSPLGLLIEEIAKDKHQPVVEFKVKERVVVLVGISSNESWQKSNARICVYVPDLYIENSKYYLPDHERLTELERICNELYYKKRLIEFEGKTLYYQAENMTQEEDAATWSHFINVKLRITNSNFK